MNDNMNAQISASQCNQIAAWLMQGNTITSLQALTKFQCMRLASRIHDLKERGMDIKKRIITLPNKKRVCEYFI